MAGVVVPGRQTDLLAELGQLLDEGGLRLAGEQSDVHVRHGGDPDALRLHGPQQRADTGVGVLHVVDGVLGVLPHRQAQVELHLGVGLGVEEPAGGVHGDLVQQVVKADGLAGALAHAHHLAVPQQLHQLHQHDVQLLGAVEVQGVQRALQTGHVAVVVGAPDVDDPVEAPDGELVAVVGDVGGEVGVKAVGPAQHVVLQVQLVHIRLLLAGLQQVLAHDVGGAEPQGAVLLIGPALGGEQIHRLRHVAALMEGGLIEPGVVMDLVPLQVGLHPGQVHGQAELGQLLLPLRRIGIQQLIAVGVIVGLGQLPDVAALIAVLREGHCVLPQDDLEVAGLDGVGELVDLVAGVVDVELPRHVGAAGGEHGGQGVAQDAAPGVAHVHGAGGVGGDEFHHDLLALQGVGGAVVIALGLHGGHHVPQPDGVQPEVQEAGAGDLGGGEVAALQVQVLQQLLGHVPGRHPQLLGGSQGKGGGEVAVFRVLGDLHGSALHLGLRQCSLGHGGAVGVHGQLCGLVFRVLDHVDHNVIPLLLLSLCCQFLVRTRILNMFFPVTVCSTAMV